VIFSESCSTPGRLPRTDNGKFSMDRHPLLHGGTPAVKSNHKINSYVIHNV
jgi:hypothetical protein